MSDTFSKKTFDLQEQFNLIKKMLTDKDIPYQMILNELYYPASEHFKYKVFITNNIYDDMLSMVTQIELNNENFLYARHFINGLNGLDIFKEIENDWRITELEKRLNHIDRPRYK